MTYDRHELSALNDALHDLHVDNWPALHIDETAKRMRDLAHSIRPDHVLTLTVGKESIPAFSFGRNSSSELRRRRHKLDFPEGTIVPIYDTHTFRNVQYAGRAALWMPLTDIAQTVSLEGSLQILQPEEVPTLDLQHLREVMVQALRLARESEQQQ